MIKKIFAIIFITLGLICVGLTVYEYVNARGNMSIWSLNVTGPLIFHGIFMIIAMFLLSPKGAKITTDKKEE